MTKNVTNKWKVGHPPGPPQQYVPGSVHDKGADKTQWMRCNWCNTAVRYVHVIGGSFTTPTGTETRAYMAGIDCASYLTGRHEWHRSEELKLRADTARQKRAKARQKFNIEPGTGAYARWAGNYGSLIKNLTGLYTQPDPAPALKEPAPEPKIDPKPYSEAPDTWLEKDWIRERWTAGELGYNVPGIRKAQNWPGAPREIIVAEHRGRYRLVLDQKVGTLKFSNEVEAQRHAWKYCEWSCRKAQP